MDELLIKALWATVKVRDGYVELQRGQTVPADVDPDALARLRRLDAVGTQEEIDSLAPRVLEGGEDPVPALETPPLSQLAEMSDEQIAGLYESGKPPTVQELVDAVGGDPALARRVLAAETARTKGDPRVSLVDHLEKVAAA